MKIKNLCNQDLPLRKIGAHWLLAFTFAMGVQSVAMAAQVVIFGEGQDALEIGQGFLVEHANECKLIMPFHVATDGASNFRREMPQPVLGDVKTKLDLGDDLGIFSITGISKQQCGASLSVLPRIIDRIVRVANKTLVRFVNADGSIGTMPINIIDDDGAMYLRIKPVYEKDRITKGMSGSTLEADGKPIGILMSVNAKSGVGTVMRQDAIIKKIETAYRSPAVSAKITSEHPPESGKWYELAAWDALPTEKIPASRVTEKSDLPPLRVNYSGKPATFDLVLNSSQNIFSGVSINVEGVNDAERPEIIELLISSSRQTTSWVSLKTSSLGYTDNVANINIVPRRAAMVRVRLSFSGSSIDKKTKPILGLRQIELIE